MSFFGLKDSEGVVKMAMVGYECGTLPINVLLIFLICRRSPGIDFPRLGIDSWAPSGSAKIKGNLCINRRYLLTYTANTDLCISINETARPPSFHSHVYYYIIYERCIVGIYQSLTDT
jgi:hypothetical protein